MTTKLNMSNDWASKIKDGAANAIKDENKGAAALAVYTKNVIMPYIGIRVQEGAYEWRPDSVEACNAVATDMIQAADLSTKGLKGAARAQVVKEGAKVRDAVNFYRACCILTNRFDGLGPNWAKMTFPVLWVKPEDMRLYTKEQIGVTERSHFLPITKAAGEVDTIDDNDNSKVAKVSMNASAIKKAAFGVTKREQAEGAESTEMPDAAEVQKIAPRLASFIEATNGAGISGDAADSLDDLLAQIAGNDSLWSLAQAHRDAYQRSLGSKVEAA